MGFQSHDGKNWNFFEVVQLDSPLYLALIWSLPATACFLLNAHAKLRSKSVGVFLAAFRERMRNLKSLAFSFFKIMYSMFKNCCCKFWRSPQFLPSQPQSKLPLQPGTVHKKPLMRLKTDVSRENARTTTNLCGIAKPKDKERMCKKFTQAQSKFFLFPPASLPCSFFFPSVHFLLEPNSQTVSEAFYNFHRFIWCKVAK